VKTIKVNLAQNTYEIRIGTGLLEQVGNRLEALGFKEKVVIITNPTVDGLYGQKLKGSLESAGLEVATLIVPDGEEYKSLEEAGKLYEQLGDFQAERNTPILALGGGVIGDLAGFVAATYLRGVPLVQIPTTLLAQVDSSIGGKVAVNHGKLKNNIGTFYQPRLVVADTDTLRTLPEVEFKNGLAEVIKYGIISDKTIFDAVAEKVPEIEWYYIGVARCAAIKADIVEKDEKDLGLRNILNYGHTVGHAIEIASDYSIKHGQGVAIGMVAAAWISREMGILSQNNLVTIRKTIVGAGLPVTLPDLPLEEILQAMQHDKKKVSGHLRFILPKTIGEVVVNDKVEMGLVEKILKGMYE
jgi:3-dehydroquinate synthase